MISKKIKELKGFYPKISFVIIITAMTSLSSILGTGLLDRIGLLDFRFFGPLPYVFFIIFSAPFIFITPLVNLIIFRKTGINHATWLVFFSFLLAFPLSFLSEIISTFNNGSLADIVYPFGLGVPSWIVVPIAYSINFFIFNIIKIVIELKVAIAIFVLIVTTILVMLNFPSF